MSRLITLSCLLSVVPGKIGQSEDDEKPTPFIDRVVMFRVGAGGGKGQDLLPDIVLGPPRGGGKLKAGRHVLSLGEDGIIVVEFVDNEVIDGKGPDYLIFENLFLRFPLKR